jgi:hypothetical protein
VLLPGRTAAKPRKYIDVLPLNNDWSEGYQAKVAQVRCSVGVQGDSGANQQQQLQQQLNRVMLAAVCVMQ